MLKLTLALVLLVLTFASTREANAVIIYPCDVQCAKPGAQPNWICSDPATGAYTKCGLYCNQAHACP